MPGPPLLFDPVMPCRGSFSSFPSWSAEPWSLRQTFAGVAVCRLLCQGNQWFLLPDHAVVRLPDSSRRSDCHSSGPADHWTSRCSIPGVRSQGRRRELSAAVRFIEGLREHQPRKHWHQSQAFWVSVPVARSPRAGMEPPEEVVPDSPQLKSCDRADPAFICGG